MAFRSLVAYGQLQFLTDTDYSHNSHGTAQLKGPFETSLCPVVLQRLQLLGEEAISAIWELGLQSTSWTAAVPRKTCLP